MGELDGKIAVITGGSRGMGRAALDLFAAEGATVVTCGRTQEDLDKAVSEIESKHGGKAYGIQTDIRDEDSVNAFMAEIGKQCGRIDMLVNNAGESSQRAAAGATMQIQVSHAPEDPELPPGRLEDMKDQEFMNAFQQKVLGMVRMTRAALPLLRISGKDAPLGAGPAIVNIVSTKGLQSPVRVVTSGIAWAAALNFSKGLSYELAPDNIRVNVLGVDRAKTSQTEKSRSRWAPDKTMEEFEQWRCVGVPFRRMGTAEEMAQAMYFLASPRSSYITGQCLASDGGAIRTL
jgi:NAD(P)-dependent dehydrogenase (short-subunit alcohol dehydrogenase family)